MSGFMPGMKALVAFVDNGENTAAVIPEACYDVVVIT